MPADFHVGLNPKRVNMSVLMLYSWILQCIALNCHRKTVFESTITFCSLINEILCKASPFLYHKKCLTVGYWPATNSSNVIIMHVANTAPNCPLTGWITPHLEIKTKFTTAIVSLWDILYPEENRPIRSYFTDLSLWVG